LASRMVGLLEKYFYFCMSLLVFIVVVYGFSHTADRNLIHPAVARPLVLYVHALIFSGWVIFFILQSGFVIMGNVRLHRRIGWFGAVLGVAIPVLGISTAITMARFRITYLHAVHVESDLIVQFFDMITFTVLFTLAIYWRKRPEFHRRLILIASCGLTSAAFGRFPSQIMPSTFFYAGVDFLVLLGVTCDLIVKRFIHQVYVYSLPALILGQCVVMYLSAHDSLNWSRIARLILG